MCNVVSVTAKPLCKDDFLQRIRKISDSEVQYIILREKYLSEQEYYSLAKEVLSVCDKEKLIIHNFIGTAESLGIKKIHLPFSAFKELNGRRNFDIVGTSVHSVDDAAFAQENGADYIFQTDSDGQTDPEEFEKFWQIREGYDAIFGNRTSRGDGFSRAVVEKVLCAVLWTYFHVSVPDANAPFRLMKTDYVAGYLPLMPENYNLPNALMTAFGAYFHRKIRFIPISFKPRQGGTNSINIRKIVKIGRQALHDFCEIQKAAAKKRG